MINNYMKADLWRISNRIPRIICILVIAAAYAVYIFMGSRGDSWNSVFLMERLLRGFLVTVTLYGIIEFMSVFADDFKAKTMQVAIGAGMKRRHVILTKWLDGICLLMSDFLFTIVIGLIAGVVTGVFINGEQMTDLLIRYLGETINAAGYLGISLIAVFYMQSVIVPLIIYLCLYLSIFKTIFDYLLNLGDLQQLNLSRFIFTNANATFVSRLTIGSFDVKSLIVIVVYIVGSYVISSFLFKKKELEF